MTSLGEATLMDIPFVFRLSSTCNSTPYHSAQNAITFFAV